MDRVFGSLSRSVAGIRGTTLRLMSQPAHKSSTVGIPRVRTAVESRRNTSRVMDCTELLAGGGGVHTIHRPRSESHPNAPHPLRLAQQVAQVGHIVPIDEVVVGPAGDRTGVPPGLDRGDTACSGRASLRVAEAHPNTEAPSAQGAAAPQRPRFAYAASPLPHSIAPSA